MVLSDVRLGASRGCRLRARCHVEHGGRAAGGCRFLAYGDLDSDPDGSGGTVGRPLGVNLPLGANGFKFSDVSPTREEPLLDGAFQLVVKDLVHVVTAGVGGALGKGKPGMTKQCKTRNTVRALCLARFVTLLVRTVGPVEVASA